jgi:hypothetical protein
MNIEKILVKKNNDEKETFSIDKLKQSLESCGATKKKSNTIANTIKNLVYNNITTNDIHKIAFDLLKQENTVFASKYNLKRAIFDLGPTGYPFEKLVGTLLKLKGYETKVGVLLDGECVTHEIDVLAEKNGNAYAIECKFHANANINSDVKIPLYINSRFLDIQKQWNSNSNNKNNLKQGWLITNTRFTDDAIRYGKCIGLSLMSWDYPLGNSIKNNIDSFGLYPITTLINLSKEEKISLISKDIILVKELYENKIILEKMQLPSDRIVNILDEVKELCKI